MPDGRPRRDLAATPESLPPLPARTSGSPAPGATTRPGTTAPAAPRGTSGAPGSAPATRPGGGPKSASPSPSHAAPFRTAGETRDTAGDAGPATPRYADLTSVTVEDDGTSARVTVRMAGDVPTRLPEDEVLGVGVDFFRSVAQVESDYQLFADGQPDGWYAYLQTPDGFVKYPGTFGVGGDRLVFTVPWSALGSPREGAFSSFADWTRAATPANVYGEDHAPDVVNARFSR